MSRLDLFRKLLKKESPEMEINDSDMLTYQALGQEVVQCSAVLKDYQVKVNQGLDAMLEINRHVIQLEKEMVRILANNPNAGAPQ